MTISPKQLESALLEATKDLATRKDLEKTENSIATAVNTAFQKVETSIADKLNRIENIIDKWPPPSYIHDLLVRVNTIEKVLKIRPADRNKI